MRAAIYARVSTAKDQTTDVQVGQLTEVAGRSGWIIPPDQVYRDDGVSGRTESRPGLDALREEIRGRRLDVVLVVRLDRLGRSVRGVLEFFDLCETNRVRVVVTSQAIDTGTPVGRFVRTILAGVAELEGELIRERTRDAMAAIKAGSRKTKSGRPPGRQPRLTPQIVAAVVEGRQRQPPTPYRALAVRLGIPIGTCRRAFSLSSRGLPAFVTPSVRRGSDVPEGAHGS
jgi:DNA invertase Pin-like site-specific DNA recombinase